ncbi:hypothetical protein ElyMa_005706800 [Elysia marginata]|uniref:ShKT domain-containing protein n=1 Tax=Elysia marginata TaxID=1093978 RepID=A0AAV4FGF6_9GAST|nr:hypothetical protein ElyMa_005706800 [Elysia marginata]
MGGVVCARYGHRSQTSLCLGIVAVLLMSLTDSSLGCFPVEDVFKASCLWIQTTSLQSRNRISVCPEHTGHEAGAPIRIESEGITSTFEPRKTLVCLRDYGGYRYKVKVTEIQPNSREVFLGYQCLKFSSLSSRVVRQEKSSVVADENQLDCDLTTYTPDEAVLIAGYLDSVTHPCPLTGGYQLLMNLGESPSSTLCMESVSSYLPQLLFECDETDSSRTIIDLGKFCTPKVLWDSQSLRGRYEAHLKCISSWQENKGSRSREFTTVLLQMRDSYRSYWCLHFQRLASESAPSGGVLYKAILTLDGRCLPDISGTWDSPKDTELVGKLVSFKPGNDTECKDKNYLNTCGYDGGADKCRKSLECPASCERCKKNVQLKECTFSEAVRGSWESLTYDQVPSLSIGKNTVQSPQFGQFLCRSRAEVGDVQNLYPMVQTGIEPTCWPYYSCAQIRSLASGLLSFQMRPALRSFTTGKLESCQETHNKVGFIRPEKAEETKTLIDRKRLKPVPCKFEEPKAYPTVGLAKGCLLLTPRCSGACNTFNISLKASTCDNVTASSAQLYAQHMCVARIQFNDDAVAVMTKILDSPEAGEVYRCWLFTRSRMYILRADYCNQNQIDSVFEYDDRPEFTYDPFYSLIMSKSMSADGSRGNMLEPNPMVIGLVLLWLAVFRASTHYTHAESCC